jgi:hypothetical protein
VAGVCGGLGVRKDIQQQNIAAFKNAGSETLEVYSLLREYIQHEDNLINHRTTWFLTLNSFLFAIVGILANVSEEPKLFRPSEVLLFLIMISTIGIVVSATSGMSVYAAYNSIKALKAIWVDKYEPEAIDFGGKATGSLLDRPDNELRFDPKMIFPYVKGGGGNRLNARRGRVIAYSLFWWIGLCWTSVCAFAVYKLGQL